jgi:hypothetical protein
MCQDNESYGNYLPLFFRPITFLSQIRARFFPHFFTLFRLFSGLVCHRIFWLVFLWFGMESCSNAPSEEKQITSAVYHWKTVFQPDSTERSFLESNAVRKIYLRFFDVDLKGSQPVPVATMRKDGDLRGFDVVPVVFITNRTMAKITEDSVASLARRIVHKIQIMARHDSVVIHEIQLDCDWTGTTRKRYFSLIKLVKSEIRIPVSVTIRLHQIKFSETTGVPPADRGMLMCYNVGDIRKPETRNSIFDPGIIHQYLKNLNQYPLELDLALPIFQWTVVFRNGHFLRILNQIGEAEIKAAGCFSEGRYPDSFEAQKDTSLFGLSVHRGDEFHVEVSQPEDVLAVRNEVLSEIRNRKVSLSYYHLDSSVLSSFDPFRKINLYEIHPH